MNVHLAAKREEDKESICDREDEEDNKQEPIQYCRRSVAMACVSLIKRWP